MEALLEKEGNVDSWNDERMDELSRRMDAGFARTADKEETRRRFDGIDSELGRVNDRLDKLFYGLGFFGLTLVLNLAADKL